ncbi:MAG: serine/threonine protein kinase [Polyangiaceae bacterium]|nr:serine/threonine protein kinase [Polyangiaceae bacterium]MCW5790882.1 serine/threonine protein kinase [Polyangiaceae bacterium]
MTTDELTPGKRLGRYELLQRIGRGGMATVWVARDHAPRVEDERLVALKAIHHELAGDQEFVDMFIDEGRLVGAIRHPNVVEVYEVGEVDGVMFLAMEWVEGDSLHALIAESGKRRPIPPEMAVRIIADAARGLHAAHELCDANGQHLGVVHRDVSPHNILIGTDGGIKLVDFGVAKAMGRLGEATQAGQLKGKFGYMSPEQARGKSVDRRADIFALGIVLFELTTTRRLFRGEHDAETLHLVVNGKIPEPRGIDPEYPEELQRIVLRALERDIELRYQTAEELASDLERYLLDHRIVVPRSGVGSLLRRVLGERIEQRRQGIRAALKAGGAPLAAVNWDAGPLSGTGSGVGSAPSQTSGLGFAGGSTNAGVPHSVSVRTPARSNTWLWATLAGVLFVVALVSVALVLRRGPATTVVTLQAPPPEPAAAPTPAPSPAPAALPSGESIDGFEVEEDAGAALQRPVPGPRPAAGPRPAPGPAAAPAPAPVPVPQTTSTLPRDNPYR